jgi:hypothetical protein
VQAIVDFGELPVFENVATFPMIFIAQKDQSSVESVSGATTFVQVKSLSNPYPDMLTLVSQQGIALPSSAISGKEWTLANEDTALQLRSMERAGIPLGNYIQEGVYRGVLTGFNKAFVIDGAKRAELIEKDPKSAEIIKPLAVGDDIRRWNIEKKDRWIIVTDVGIDIKRYPSVFKHLSQYKEKLEERWDKGNHWWELRPCGYYDVFDKPKIVYPEIAKSTRFTLDKEGLFLNNKVFLIAFDDLYLLGVLNSSPAWQFAKSICSVLGNENAGGRVMLQYTNFQKLPIPYASPAERSHIEYLVQKCLDAEGIDCEEWEREIDERVAALYERGALRAETDGKDQDAGDSRIAPKQTPLTPAKRKKSPATSTNGDDALPFA